MYTCPAGKTLKRVRESRLRDLKKIEYGNPKACRVCALRSRCTRNIRHISRLDNEGVLDRMAERVSEKPEILNRRREIVEHPFGTIKQWMNQGAFLTRGLENVRAEFSLTRSSTISAERSTSFALKPCWRVCMHETRTVA
ncbi:transposase [Bradyrhizobium ottawaense]|uniref:transposase n=1 Tax=Bradyrhizobium ottawaense TaxID=931866 RepID=UPI00384FFE57